jgi:peptidoglycan/xylan/chitin deacetylase (PgdA/CDA1 family)
VPPARVALWVASLGGIALAVRSVFLGPVPMHIAFVAFLAYLALCTAGVLVPRLEMFGDVLWRGDPGTRAVALTFDDGPHPSTTPRVLELLGRRGARATFFMIGEKVERYPDVARAVARAGHSIGVHGQHHDRLYALLPPNAVRDDIRRAADVIERVTGVRPRWFRPPVGQVSPRTAAGAKRAGFEIVGWTVRGLDGLERATSAKVLRRVERGLRAGAIVLLHDAAEREDFVPASIDALPDVLAAIEARGLRVASLEELLGPP